MPVEKFEGMLMLCQSPGCFAPAKWLTKKDQVWWCGPCGVMMAFNNAVAEGRELKVMEALQFEPLQVEA